MTRLRTTVLLLLIAALGAGVAIGWAASQSDEVEVRVVARPHADGRIEIGVEHDGQRLLPSQRYVTPELTRTRVGVWLRSSPVTLDLCDDDDRYDDDDRRRRRYDDDDGYDDDRYDDDDGIRRRRCDDDTMTTMTATAADTMMTTTTMMTAAAADTMTTTTMTAAAADTTTTTMIATAGRRQSLAQSGLASGMLSDRPVAGLSAAGAQRAVLVAPSAGYAPDSRSLVRYVFRGEMNPPCSASVTVIPCSRSIATAAAGSRTVSAAMNIPSPRCS